MMSDYFLWHGLHLVQSGTSGPIAEDFHDLISYQKVNTGEQLEIIQKGFLRID